MSNSKSETDKTPVPSADTRNEIGGVQDLNALEPEKES